MSPAGAGRAADQVRTLDTREGPARVHVFLPATHGGPAGRGTIVLGHGAGGGIGAADLQAVSTLAVLGWTVGLVEQPWRVAGGRVATPPPRLDAAWCDLLPQLDGSGDGAGDGAGQPLPRPLVVGGRSAGARVACRTSPGTESLHLPRADAVLCLAFPLHPPGRPDKSRADELAVPVRLGVPTLVVQGAADPFGTPEEVRQAVVEADPHGVLTVVEVPGSHSPTRSLRLLADHVVGWLDGLGGLGTPGRSLP